MNCSLVVSPLAGWTLLLTGFSLGLLTGMAMWGLLFSRRER